MTPRAGTFQSTRPRGARPLGTIQGAQAKGFNPRARVGRDLPGQRGCLVLQSFNPRARVGRDDLVAAPAFAAVAFQSTRPRGARPTSKPPHSIIRGCFNPRARVGRDETGTVSDLLQQGFNPRARVGRDWIVD